MKFDTKGFKFYFKNNSLLQRLIFIIMVPFLILDNIKLGEEK